MLERNRTLEKIMEIYNINLNIHYSAPQEVWDKLEKLYSEMPGWIGFYDGCVIWYGEGEKLIEACVEPSGLQFFAKMEPAEWESWIALFKSKASVALGYEIGEPEDGFAFRYYE